MLKPSGINKYAKKDPENLLHENLYKKFGQRFVDYRKRYSDNINYLDLDKKMLRLIQSHILIFLS